MLVYDLHSHSTASDGTLSPTDLITRAKQQGVDVLALTDHDTLAGLDEAHKAAKENQLTLISGVEVSASWGSHTLHIVGLGVDPNNQALQKGLQQLQNIRVERARKIAEKLEKAGIPNALAGAQALAGAGNVTRTHFARHIVNMGKANNVNDVFKHYLKPNKPGYVTTHWADLEQALDWIVQAGGQAVIAHPDRYNITASKFRAFLAEFKDLGGTAIEVVHSNANRDAVLNNANFARTFGLKASMGSDFHSPGSPWVELGKLPPLPSDLIPVWESWSFP
jgi:hypothetical protein